VVAPAATAATGQTSSADALAQLVARATKENQATISIVSSFAKVAPRMADTFKRRFGLTSDVKLDVSGGTPSQFQKAVAETQAGSPPTFDGMNGEDIYLNQLLAVDGVQLISDWQLLLRQVNPVVGSGQVAPEVVSPSVFAGKGFLYSTRTKSLLYNTDLVQESELPKARADLAEPRFKDRFAITIFMDEWLSGLLAYSDRPQWLAKLDAIGKNSSTVMNSYDLVMQRMLLGEFPMSPSNTYYYFQYRAQDPKTPIGVRFFADYTFSQNVLHAVRKGARSPATATLFSLWMTTPESQAIWQPDSAYTNLAFGTSELDKSELQRIKDSGTKLVNYFESPQSMQALEWLSSPEGRQYAEAATRSITQRKS
jgi:ABC-type Fe3+ transport system substrate-binding protein